MIYSKPLYCSMSPLPFVSISILIIENAVAITLALVVPSFVDFIISIAVNSLPMSHIVNPVSFVYITVLKVVLSETVSKPIPECTKILASVMVLFLVWSH